MQLIILIVRGAHDWVLWMSSVIILLSISSQPAAWLRYWLSTMFFVVCAKGAHIVSSYEVDANRGTPERAALWGKERSDAVRGLEERSDER